MKHYEAHGTVLVCWIAFITRRRKRNLYANSDWIFAARDTAKRILDRPGVRFGWITPEHTRWTNARQTTLGILTEGTAPIARKRNNKPQ